MKKNNEPKILTISLSFEAGRLIPILVTALLHLFAYYGTKIIHAGRPFFNAEMPLDAKIPFIAFFAVFYYAAFLQWMWNAVVILKEDDDVFYRVLSAEMIALIVVIPCFFLFPVTMQRPEVKANGFFDLMVYVAYAVDTPTNLFPSMHCVNSWICLRTAFLGRKTSKGWRIFSLILTVLVCCSTVLVKQHLILDTVSGIALAEIAFLAAKKLPIAKLVRRPSEIQNA